MKVDLSYDSEKDRWRLVVPDTGEVMDCRGLAPLVVKVYQAARFEAFNLPVLWPETSLFYELAEDFTAFWVNHSECETARDKTTSEDGSH